ALQQLNIDHNLVIIITLISGFYCSSFSNLFRVGAACF
ncbi:hypothetical protein AAUPMB_09771, partial [Pasteurella multocida subsp. multocida str. Anand1_buffalo]